MERQVATYQATNLIAVVEALHSLDRTEHEQATQDDENNQEAK
jgi:hypothetical protein